MIGEGPPLPTAALLAVLAASLIIATAAALVLAAIADQSVPLRPAHPSTLATEWERGYCADLADAQGLTAAWDVTGQCVLGTPVAVELEEGR